jgi:hypothetical protein
MVFLDKSNGHLALSFNNQSWQGLASIGHEQ